METRYLGDGVYADTNGFHIVLKADDNVIYLEDTVFQALLDYARKIGWLPETEAST